MIELIVNKDSCTGCGACRAICPVAAIEWHEDYEGAMRPNVNINKCIHCHKCASVCSDNITTDKILEHNNHNLVAYAAQANNRELLMKSSSGGIFGLLAMHVLSEGGVVCGCVWEKDFKSVRHKLIDTLEELPLLYESKYLQSEVPPEVYKEISATIKKRRKVLFCGTPCEIQALTLFLKSSMVSQQQVEDNLFRVALICHGVPTSGVWRRFADEEEAKNNGKHIVNVRFRDKRISWNVFSQVISFSNGIEMVGNIQKTNAFMSLFLDCKNTILRRSCSFCKCKLNYQADITLGDFWGIDKVIPNLIDSDGVSAVILHSQQGQSIFKAIQMKLAFCFCAKVEDIERFNGLWRGCYPLHPKRNRFFYLFNKRKLILEDISRCYAQGNCFEKINKYLRIAVREMCRIIAHY